MPSPVKGSDPVPAGRAGVRSPDVRPAISKARPLRVWMAQAGIIWLFLASADWVLLNITPNTIIHTYMMLVIPRIKNVLLVKEILFLIPLALMMSAAAVLQDIGNRLRPGLLRVALKTSAVMGTGILLFVYLSSWIMFRSGGIFLDGDSLEFLAIGSVQLLQHLTHMEPYVALGLPVILALGVFLLLRATGRVSRWHPWPLFIFNLIVFALITAACVFFLSKRLSTLQRYLAVNDPNAGIVYSIGDLYDEYHDTKSGPALHVASWLESLRAPDEAAEVKSDIPITYRPVITMDEYLKMAGSREIRRWNVVIILVESLRWDQISHGGSQFNVMPNVEEIARESFVFTNHRSQSSHSNYSDLCPLSSHYPLRSERTHVYPENPTYPRVLIYDILKALGYRTAVISSQNETWGKMINYLQTGGIDHFFHSETFDGPTYIPYNDTGMENFVKGSKRAGKIDDRLTVAESIRWIKSIGNAPFFIYMNLQNSHIPYDTPADFPIRFGTKDLPFTIRFSGYPPEEAPRVKEKYMNSLAYVDEQIGKLIAYLKESGKWDSTVFVVTGDTGQAFFEHGFAAHANKLFDECLRVPLVIASPLRQQKTDSRLCQHIDVPPTLLDMMGLPPHPSFQGISLMADPPSVRSVYLVAQSLPARQYAVIRSDYKYIYDYRMKKEYLFNLKEDPGEKLNLILKNPDVAKDLSMRVQTWRNAQVGYYSNFNRHSRYYPPVLEE